MMLLLAFIAFFALVVLWMIAPTSRPMAAAAPEGSLASSSSLSGADAAA